MRTKRTPNPDKPSELEIELVIVRDYYFVQLLVRRTWIEMPYVF